ncbi:MAG: FAD/NAD(P)-binding protein [Acidobacteriota bacterium]
MKKITIIGGGASGTLLAVNLVRNAGQTPIKVNLIEKRANVGRGVAFGTEYETHLLNVPAAKMGGVHDDVEHFYKWLGGKGYSYEPNSFVPRKIFGMYLGDLLQESKNGSAPPNAKLNLIDDEAIDLIERNGVLNVALSSGTEIVSDHAVLAFGNFLPPHPSVEDQAFITSNTYFQNPWTTEMYESLGADDSVFIVGTGLSMVDVAMHLNAHDHRGKIHAISTRGLLPAVHELGFTYPAFYDELKPIREITAMLKAVRRHIAVAEANGSNWRGVIDSLRPVTQQIWLDLPLAEKKYFKQHLSRYWNVARHRMPAKAAEVLNRMQEAGQLEILKGRLRKIEFDRDQFDIEYSADGMTNQIHADVLINCIGSESNFSNVDSPLVKNLMSHGSIRNDDLAMGLDATPDGSIIGTNGAPSATLHTLGTALRGVLWESTAIPEIRVQANKLALKLLRS